MTAVRGAGLITMVALAALGFQTWSSGDFTSLWWTPDQRGRLAYQRKDYAQAASLFEDPSWRGAAAYAAGQYPDAAESFARDPVAVGFYNRGNALMKGREYAQAIASFELAVETAPGWTQAADNLRLARHVLDYIESTREQSGTDGKLEADEYRFDASRERGERAVIDDRSIVEQQSAEKWMRSVNTQTCEFLEIRFLLEASRGVTP